MAVSVILWDFGDTLCDERWMLLAPPSCPSWIEAWQQAMATYANGWNDGSVDFTSIREALAERTSLSGEAVEAHVLDRCRAIDFFPTAWAVTRQRRRRQAIVTINPAIFGEWVGVPHGLAQMFDAIVVSGVERTADKVRLCDIALGRMGYAGERSAVLLIDNRRENVDSWRASGGAAYWFEDDEAFGRDVDRLIAVE